MGFRAVPAATRILACLCIVSTAACGLVIGLNELNEVPCVGDCSDGSSAPDALEGAADALEGAAGNDAAAGDGSADRDGADDVASDRMAADRADDSPDSPEDTGHDGLNTDAEADGAQDGDAGEAGPCPCLTGYMQSVGTCIGYMPPGGSCLPPGLVALPRTGWVASASTTGGDGGDGAVNAIDGNECSRYSTDASQATGDWFELDLGAPYAFGVIMLDGDSDPADFPSRYAVYVSGDGMTWSAAVANGLGSSSGATTVVFPEQTARYIKIQLTAGASNPWSIDEIKVFSAHPPPGTPVPLSQAGWTATASVTDTAPQGIDGNLTTRFSTQTNAVAGMWFQVDMGTAPTFSQITMDTYGNPPGCADFARGYAVYVSNDATNWTAVAMGTDMAEAILTVSFAPQTARYIQVQLTQTAGPWWSIGEFNVYY
jgi:hypothetical protein